MAGVAPARARSPPSWARGVGRRARAERRALRHRLSRSPRSEGWENGQMMSDHTALSLHTYSTYCAGPAIQRLDLGVALASLPCPLTLAFGGAALGLHASLTVFSNDMAGSGMMCVLGAVSHRDRGAPSRGLGTGLRQHARGAFPPKAASFSFIAPAKITTNCLPLLSYFCESRRACTSRATPHAPGSGTSAFFRSSWLT